MNIHISGSIAYDRIMSFGGKFKDYILADKLDSINVSFFMHHIEEKRGGTATNVAYNLYLMGEKPSIYATVGRDFQGSYQKDFTAMGVIMNSVVINEELLTPCCHISCDEDNNQITAFSAGSMLTALSQEFYPQCQASDIAILSPGNMEDMKNFIQIYKENKVAYIYDPSQQIPVIEKEDLIEGISGAKILIGNDYEIGMICKKTGLTKEELILKVQYLITTLAENGCEIASANGISTVKAVQVENVVEPTGAGDSFRAGLIKGLIQGLSIEECVQAASVVASFCIEKYGTQEHSFTFQEFDARHLETYGEKSKLSF